MRPRVIVLGVGGMGSAACYHLAKAGAEVVGLEQFALGHAKGSSHGETRIIRKAYFEHPDYVPLLLRAYELWAELERGAGAALYHETGILYYCPPGSALAKGILGSAARYGLEVRGLSDSEAETYQERFRRPAGHDALYEPEAGYLEVENCVLAHAQAAEKLGARILTGERALSWEASASGVRVVTARGEHRADRLVVAGGAWSGALLKELGLPLTLKRKRLYWFPADRRYQGAPCFFYELGGRVFYGFPALGGELKVAQHTGGEALEDPALLESPAPPGDAAEMEGFAARHLPGLAAGPSRTKPCLYTMTPDEHFIIDAHPRHGDVVFAAGFSGHGFKFSSVVGEVLAELALEGRTEHPIGFLRLRPS